LSKIANALVDIANVYYIYPQPTMCTCCASSFSRIWWESVQ